jgi:hypothetical protein
MDKNPLLHAIFQLVKVPSAKAEAIQKAWVGSTSGQDFINIF